jgi:two-component system C4-dicarboxylate transport sensor histidine kinase DctB
MGLGLSISYNIIKDFGGEISATNSSDGGAVFKVTLMIAKQEDLNEAAQ